MRIQLTNIRRGVALLPVALIIFSALQSHGETVGIPLKPDPPIAIDGQLGDWSKVPGGWDLTGVSHVTGNRKEWRGNDDLSANVKLAWRREGLYVAADVTDDQIRVQHGANMWKGDYIGLYVDTTPDIDKDRTGFGAGQFNIGLSPGNFKHTGDIFTDLSAEAFMFSPRMEECPDVQVASQRTEKGYTIETLIPWKVLGVTSPSIGMKLGIEVMVSDCDSVEPRQEKFMTLLTLPWSRERRDRLVNAVLAGADGKAVERVEKIGIFDSVKLANGEKKVFEFDAPQIPNGQDAVIDLFARLYWEQPAGNSPGMRLILNGVPLDGKRLVNKAASMDTNGGEKYAMASGDLFYVFYSPDYTSVDAHPVYGLKGARACQFDLKVTDLIKPGRNTLEIANGLPLDFPRDLYAGSGSLEFIPIIKPKVKQGPPTGQIPEYAPLPILNGKYTVEKLQNGDIAVTLGKDKYIVESQYSTPAPAWVKDSNKYFTVSREIEKKSECVIVRDTYTNLTNENLPLMHRHFVKIPGLKKYWLAGLAHESAGAFSSSSENPTGFGVSDGEGLGLCALDDVFRIHTNNYMKDGTLGLADNNLVLTPGAKYTAEWAIVPESRPDYYAFINSLRRLMGVNFRIDGDWAFLNFAPDETKSDPTNHTSGSMNDEQVRELVKNKSLIWLCSSYTYPRYKSLIMNQGAYWTRVDHSYEKSELLRFKKAAPNVKYMTYFHSFLDPLPESAARFSDDRMLQADGKQVFYGGYAAGALFIPTETNPWGREIAKNIDYAFDDIGYQGIYWDEFETSASAYHYGKPWDGVSADIDPTTMKIARLKSSIPLLSQNWRIALAKHAMTRGPLIGNGAPWTRSTASIHFPRFTETGSISNCTLTQLYTPIALGDHLTERSELDCYNDMLAALDYGCVYCWYSPRITVTHPTLTSYTYPISPVEIHEGYIIGKERILTNRSGLYGWGDNSKHETHVFNDQGREVPGFKAPTVMRGGKTYTELRIGEGWSAAILRK